ncbi:MAG: PmoA family protein [Aurantibacter sp.]
MLPFCSLFIFWGCSQKEVFQFEVKNSEGVNQSSPIFVDDDFLQGENIENFKLMKNDVSLDFQSEGDKIWFLHNPEKGISYSFEKNKTPSESSPEYNLGTFKENGNLQLVSDNNRFVSYRYEMTYPPNGIDSIFKKSGYIHPIVTPKGDTLTRIQPPDHYHHYGLWGPWTHTRIDTTRVDFWNLGEGMGTVLFKEFKDTSSGDLFSSFTAAQEHIDLKTKKEPQVALNEDLQVRLWNLDRPDRYMFDYTTSFSSPLENGILFEAYRYGGGIGLRFTERWKADNCTVLTSEGKDRLSADGSNARWCIVSGEASDGQGTNGILFMSHPKNRMHPEPMRIWPIDGNDGRGDMFFEFCPIRHEEWKIEPKRDYQLKYRMVVFDGELKAEEAEAYWQAFANPKEIRINSN